MIGIIVLIGAIAISSYAYFVANISGTGNTNNQNTSKLQTAELASILYNNGENFTSEGSYPGYKNIHSFKIKPKDDTKGIGTYQILLNSTIAEEFKSDVTITLYKTTNPGMNNLSRTEGTVVENNNGNTIELSKVDTITINGTPSKIYNDVLKNNQGFVLETKNFDETMKETTYYLVYEYLNKEESQDNTQNKSFNGKVSVQLINTPIYEETILNGTDPILRNNLIPVTIEQDGSVKKADTTKEWYSYEKKTWVNAIILEDESKSYNNGEVIPESNIESYFVWIPRYKYQIFDEGNYPEQGTIENKVQEIKVVFESTEETQSNGSTKGNWLTHPAFISFNSNGMWVGKYESGYKGATTKEQAQVNVNDSNKLQIKPNVYSWRNIQVANAFQASYNYRRNMESHMMKNTEWGAVAYLQHSKYGSQASVRINNNSSFITGYSAVNEPTCGYTAQNDECNRYEGTSLNADGTYTKRYNSDTGVLASTTGNINGVYDMSGGAWEYMMGIMVDEAGKPMSGRNCLYNSGFNGTFGCPTCDSDTTGKTSLTNGINFPSDKYYDQYAYAEISLRYDRRILGDATGEMGPFPTKQYGSVTPQSRKIGSWYADEAWFVIHSNPWFHRGGAMLIGNGTGVFAFDNEHGRADGSYSFRVVLSI